MSITILLPTSNSDHNEFLTRLSEVNRTIGGMAYNRYRNLGMHTVDDAIGRAFYSLWQLWTERADEVPLRENGAGYWVVCAKNAMRGWYTLEKNRNKFHTEPKNSTGETNINDVIAHLSTKQFTHAHQRLDDKIDMDRAIEAAAKMVSEWDKPRMLELIQLIKEGHTIKSASKAMNISYDKGRGLMDVTRKVMAAALKGEEIEEKRHPPGSKRDFGHQAIQKRIAKERDPIAYEMHLRGYKNREIANHFGVHISTAAQMVKRGRKMEA